MESGTEPKPLLIYDGDCGFCRRWVARWKKQTAERIDYASYQGVAPRFPEIPLEQFQQAVQLISTDGTRCSGAEAVFETRARGMNKKGWLWIYHNVPGFGPLSRLGYRFVARHR